MSEAILYDPYAPGFPARAVEAYRRLRDEHPVYRHPTRGFYALSRFEDVRAAANDPATFSSEGTSIAQGLLPTIQSLDPPRHDGLRRLVTLAFTPRRVAAMEPAVRQIARELVERFAGKGRCDLKRELAAELPSRVIGEMIGLPPGRRADFLEWTEAMVETPADGSLAARSQKAAAAIYGAFAELLEARRARRRDDLMSALLDAELEGERLSQQELLGFCFVLVVAGNDTTTNLIANGAVLLARHPEVRERIARDPSLLPGAIEEMLRLESPAQALPRIATRDVALHGVTIPKGAEVMLVWAAANRDERAFPDPDRFDIERPIRRHLAFGQGIHFCLGANLARLEARVAFEELLARVPDYALDGPADWLDSQWARSPCAVPIRFDPARAPVGG